MSEELLAAIRSDPAVAELLTRFDFDIARVANGPVEDVRLASGEPLEMIAGDSAGGAFLLAGAGDERAVVYAGSEGEGGLVARDLRTALTLIVGLPSIHDALTRPVAGDGGAGLRAWLDSCDDEIREDWPELDQDRAEARRLLGLPEVDNAGLVSFHAAAADERYRLISDEGNEYEPMLR